MDWANVAVLGLFVIACVLAIYRSKTDDWAINQQIGAVIFLIGAAIGLFLDDLLPTNSSIHPWVEPIGASIIVVGLLVSWVRQPG